MKLPVGFKCPIQTLDSKLFPSTQIIQITSEPTERYNCVAWAIGDTENWWWFDEYWPRTTLFEDSRREFQETFESLGFEIANSANYETGWLTIVFFGTDEWITHAARALPNGKFSSK